MRGWSFAVVSFFLITTAPLYAFRVRICGPGGDCYIFDDPEIPKCADWRLSGSTCEDLRVATNVTVHNYLGGQIEINYQLGVLFGIVTEDDAECTDTVPLLDVRSIATGAFVGVAAAIHSSKDVLPLPTDSVNPPTARAILTLEAITVDRKTGALLERRSRSIDVSDAKVVASIVAAPDGVPIKPPKACPSGTYPPNCYPCLGCEPCNDGSEDYCDTVWGSIASEDVSPCALANGYILVNGRLKHRSRHRAVRH
jgi:hypothetical protein